MHKPVLLQEVIKFLQPQKGKIYLDATIGCGGYTAKILELCPECIVIGIDWDKNAIEYTKQRLAQYVDKNLILIRENFVNIKQVIDNFNIKTIDAAVLDFGFSTLQIKSGRGFSFNDDTLDMRMDVNSTMITAKDVVNRFSFDQLTEIFLKYGEEKFAKLIAKKIVEYRKSKPITSAKELADIVALVKNRKYKKYKNYKLKIHPATKVFQSLRIFVNNELNNIETGLNNIVDVLTPGGHVIAISYHSLEDRIVKNVFKTRTDVKILTKKPITPQIDEVKTNISARSAKLRVGEKL